MKRFSFITLAVTLLMLVCGVNSAKAQISKGYEVVPMAADVQSMCEQVIDLQLDDPDKGNKIFMKALKKVSKDKDQLISMGDFFLDKKAVNELAYCHIRIREGLCEA